MRLRIGLLAASVSTGCFIHDPQPPDPPPHPEPRVPVMTITPNLDLLFVIDDSPTMADKQSSFQRAFPTLLAELSSAVEGGLPNLHLGVISSDMGTLGSSDGAAGPSIGQVGQGGCAGAGKAGNLQLGTATLANDQPFMVIDRDDNKNFTGDLAATFTQLSSLGSAGCGFEQPLHAIRAGLSIDQTHNDGFLRSRANLAVVVLSDEDDCSLEHSSMLGPDGGPLGPLQSFRCFRFGVECDQDPTLLGSKTHCRPATSTEFIESTSRSSSFLMSLKPQGGVMFGAIVGTSEPVIVEQHTVNGQPQTGLAHSCTYLPAGATVDVGADPGVRYAALAAELAGFGVPTQLESICSDDLSPQASRIGGAIKDLMNNRCLPLLVSDCVVTDESDADPAFTNTLEECSDGAGAECFRFVDDPTCEVGKRLEVLHPVPGRPSDLTSTLQCKG